jgi:gas vesicle protein
VEHLRDRLEDTEKWLARFAELTVEIAMLKVAQSAHVSRGQLADELGRTLEQVRKERERAMSELRTEMKGAFGDALKDALKEHAEQQAEREEARALQNRKNLQLYTRVGFALIVVLLAKDVGSLLNAGRMIIGLP